MKGMAYPIFAKGKVELRLKEV